MNCNIILHPNCRGWVIEKMALRLDEALRELGVRSAVTPAWSPTADINHFMIFHYVEDARPGRNTMLITHVDDALKYRMIRDSLAVIEAGICMSQMTVDLLVNAGMPKDQLCYILPANDKSTVPRRLVIGITSNLPPDGRKREFLLAQLAQEMDLSDFHFDVFGRGWTKTAEQLRAGGATVSVTDGTADYDGDYREIRRRIPHFDYYFYMGLDEGSLGTLDALSAGVPTIITAQGFHLDIPHAITHPFLDFAELREIFLRIAQPRRERIQAASALTWAEHARRHLALWTAMLEGRRPEFIAQLHATARADRASAGRGTQRRPLEQIGDYFKLTNQYRWNMFKRYYLPRVKRRVLRAREKLGLGRP